MKVKDVIERLDRYDGELPCFIYADHGQNNEPVFSVSLEECGEEDPVEGVCIAS